MDRWLPANNTHSALVISNTDDKRSFSVAKQKMTNLNTIRIMNSMSKAGHLLSIRGQVSGKRLRDNPGVWWLRERDLSSTRREPWPSRRGRSTSTSRTSPSSYSDENECQRKHLLLWRHLELSDAYLEPGSGGDG